MPSCKLCGKEIAGAVSCIESHIVIDNKKFRPILFQDKSSTVFGKKRFQARCPECNVRLGGFHHVGCSLEICPKCRRRWVYCRCFGIKVRTDELAEKECKIIKFAG